MIIEAGNRFPSKAPMPPCDGWLAHNTQACACYAIERRAAGRYDPYRASINRNVVTDIYDLPDDHGEVVGLADDDRPSGAIFWIAICILVPLFMLAGYGVGKGLERLWQ